MLAASIPRLNSHINSPIPGSDLPITHTHRRAELVRSTGACATPCRLSDWRHQSPMNNSCAHHSASVPPITAPHRVASPPQNQRRVKTLINPATSDAPAAAPPSRPPSPNHRRPWPRRGRSLIGGDVDPAARADTKRAGLQDAGRRARVHPQGVRVDPHGVQGGVERAAPPQRGEAPLHPHARVPDALGADGVPQADRRLQVPREAHRLPRPHDSSRRAPRGMHTARPLSRAPAARASRRASLPPARRPLPHRRRRPPALSRC